MNTEVLKKVQSKMLNKRIPVLKPGYTVEIDTLIKEGKRERVQKFRGLVISVSGSGTDRMITVRKISKGYGVEKKLPIYSPNVGKIKVIKKEEVRRSKLFFMRKRVGKNAMRIKKGKAQFVSDDELEFIDEHKEAEEAVMTPEELGVTSEVDNTSNENSQEAEVVEESIDKE